MFRHGASKPMGVLNADTTLFWMRTMGMGVLTPAGLEKYVDWLREWVLRDDRELIPETWRTDFDFYQSFRNSPIVLCMAASVGTKVFLERNVTKAECEALFARLQPHKEAHADVDEDKLIRDCLKQLNEKLDEFAEHPSLLPADGLLFLR